MTGNPSSTPPPVTEVVERVRKTLAKLEGYTPPETPQDWACVEAAQLIAALAARSNQEATVACQHEPYQGRCAHCDVEFKGGKPVQEATRTVGDAELVAENARLRAENDRLSQAVCSGILGDLLAPDENEALLSFIKGLRAAIDALSHTSSCGGEPGA